MKVNQNTIKKVQKTIKLNYLLSLAVDDYAERNGIAQIEIYESALTEWFMQKKENQTLKDILELVQLMLNNQITMANDIEEVKKVLDNTEIV